MAKWLIIFHLLGAVIWVGGHLLLVLRYLPKAFREKDVSHIVKFEKQYEPLGIPALLVQVITGIALAHLYKIQWFDFSHFHYALVSTKLLLLFATVLLAVHARFFIIPKLSVQKLPLLAAHIILVTLVALAMLYLGASFRFGTI